MLAIWRSISGRKTLMMIKMHCLQRNFLVPSSSLLVPVKVPSPMESHFWYILPNEVKSKALMDQYDELLSPYERDGISSLHTDQLKKSALLARTLVRTTIARYQVNSQITPASIKFKKNVHGKPEVDWQLEGLGCPVPLHFNISHTASLIACGVTIGSPIGIDVEEKDRKLRNGVLSFAKRYFTPHELEYLSAISDLEVQRQEFLKLWILKEAYVKALGLGFSAAPFSTFTLRVRAASKEQNQITTESKESEILVEPIHDSTDLTSNWQFKLLELAGSHYAAVCTENAETVGDNRSCAMKLKVWKTIPLVEDEFVCGTNAAVEL